MKFNRTVIGVAVALGCVVSCSVGVDDGDQVSLGPVDSAAFYSEVESIVATLELTPDERVQATIDSSRAFQDFLSDCMAEREVDYFWPGIPTVAVPRATYDAQWWLPADMELASSVGLGYTVNSGFDGVLMAYPDVDDNGYLQLDESERSRYDRALGECLAEEGAQVAQMPERSPEQVMLDDLVSEFSAVSSGFGFELLRDDLHDCLEERVPGFDRDEGLWDFTEASVGSILAGLSPASPGVTDAVERALAVETSIAIAEVECRAPLEGRAAALLRPAFDDWLDRYPEQATVSSSVPG